MSYIVQPSLAAAGASAAPTAGSAVATIAAPPAGVYSVAVTVSLTGTGLAVGDMANLELFNATNVVTKLVPGTQTLTVRLDGSSALTVAPGANATASTVYAASIVATLVAAF